MKKFGIKISLIFSMLGLSLPFLTACQEKEDKITSFELYKQVNEFLDECDSNGLTEELHTKWMNPDCDKYVPLEELEGKNGNINIATSSVDIPFSLIYDNKPSGMSIDYMYHFAKEYGYSITVHDYNSPASTISALVSGKDDIIASATTITEERKESICFSKPFYLNSVINVVLKENQNIYNTKESLAGQNIGINLGTMNRELVNKDIDNANILEYTSIVDMLIALKKGDIKSFYVDSAQYDYVVNTDDEYVTTYISDQNGYGFGFSKFGIQSFNELQDATIATLDGSVYDTYLKEQFPNSEIISFKSLTNCAQAVTNSKVDAFVSDYAIAREMTKELNGFYILDNEIATLDVATAFPKTEDGDIKRNLFNDFLRDKTIDGSLEKLKIKWLNYDENSTDTNIAYDKLENINGVFKLSVDPTITPFVMLKDNKCTGFEIELFYEFCKENGYQLKIEQMNFDSLISSLVTNDAAASMILVTDERKESVNFSDVYYNSDIILVCKTNVSNKENFFESIGDSFYKTFIKENRWKLILSGVANTLLITFFAVIGGIIIGVILYMLCKDNNKIANLIAKIYSSILHNVPVVVILMIFYYIVFGKSEMSGILVSIIVFSLTFSTSIFGMLKTSISAIGQDQFEAGYALGYRKNQMFFKIILPQASRLFYPQLCADIVSLLKETAIVGYIAVMDLTKAGDIIRSRTYEAFFPLIASALIYFLLAVLLIYVVKLIQKLTDPKRVKKINVKGVNHDRD